MKAGFDRFMSPWCRLFVAAVALALVSCGGGSDPSSTPSGATPGFVPFSALQTPAALPRDNRRAAADTFTGNGWYWDAAAGGTGMMFEAQGDAGFLGLFMYEADGHPVWYAAGGTFATEGPGYRFTGELRQYANGQALNGTYRTPTSIAVGTLSVAFTGSGTATKASTVLPGGRTWNMERFNFGALGWGPAPTQPEAGWFWNKAEGGRGYAVEVQGTQVFMAMFHYTAAGAPTWQIVAGDISSGVMPSVPFNAYAGGQTLAGPPKTPTTAQEGTAAVSFSRACDGNLMLPGASQWLGIERFAFGTTQPCRTTLAGNPFGGNLVTSVAEASYTFLSEERKAWNVLNAERSRCGFGMLSQNPTLDLAARNHRDYMIANPGIEFFGHTEVPGRSGFTGISPQDRTNAVGYSGITSEDVTGLAQVGANLQGSSRARILLSTPYHAIDLLMGRREIGFGIGGGTFVATSGTWSGVASQIAPGVRTFPCQGSVEAGFAGNGEIPSPFPNEQNPIWGTPILVKGDAALRIATASITGPEGVVPLKVIYGDGQTTDPNGFCTGDTSCVIPVMLAKKTVYQVRLTGTNGGQPLHPSGALTFSFTTSGTLN